MEIELPNGAKWDKAKGYLDQEEDAKNWADEARNNGDQKNGVKIAGKYYNCMYKGGALICVPCKKLN
jgi:hypothetical protein